MKQRSVDFLIVGSMRAGTTTLTELLNRHKNISLPRRELYFFSFTSNYRRGEDWYEKCIAKQTLPVSIVGEKCVSYGYTRGARDRIWKYSPKLRLIWILRDPVQRAFSHYIHNVNNGIETRSFIDAVEDEYEGRTNERFRRYLARSRYVIEISYFLERFPISQVYATTLEQLVATPQDVLVSLFGFLGATSDEYCYRAVALNRKYQTALPRLVGWCAKTFGYFSPFHRAARLIRFPIRHPPLAPERLKQQLDRYFDEDNQELRRLMGLDLTLWNQPTS